MSRIKKNDQVIVIAGKDKGKTGKVIEVFLKENRVLVEHVNLIKKAQKPNSQSPQGGLIEIEGSIHISNVMLIDKKSSKPTRVGVSVAKDGTKTRISKRSGEVI